MRGDEIAFGRGKVAEKKAGLTERIERIRIAGRKQFGIAFKRRASALEVARESSGIAKQIPCRRVGGIDAGRRLEARGRGGEIASEKLQLAENAEYIGVRGHE